MKKLLSTLMCIGTIVGTMGCTDAEVASRNISKAADQFEIARRTVFYNGITDKYILVVEGRCSISHQHNKLALTCKVGDTQYIKHYLGLSHNVTYFSEQLRGTNVSTSHYRVIFKPSVIIPNIDIE